MIECKCPACSKAYKVRDELAGKSAKCGCGNRFIIPAPAPISAPEPQPQPIEQPKPVAVKDAPPAAAPAASPIEPIPPSEPMEKTTSWKPVPQEPAARDTGEPPVPRRTEAGSFGHSVPAGVPFQPLRPVGLQPAVAPVAPAATDAKDEGNGGVGRLTFILALVFVTVIAAILAKMARHSGMQLRMVALVWATLSAVAMFVVTQARLINIGYNEWFALLLPVMIGFGAILPEGFKAPPRSNAPKPKNAGALMAGSIAITIAFAAACAGFAYYLLYIA